MNIWISTEDQDAQFVYAEDVEHKLRGSAGSEVSGAVCSCVQVQEEKKTTQGKGFNERRGEERRGEESSYKVVFHLFIRVN